MDKILSRISATFPTRGWRKLAEIAFWKGYRALEAAGWQNPGQDAEEVMGRALARLAEALTEPRDCWPCSPIRMAAGFARVEARELRRAESRRASKVPPRRSTPSGVDPVKANIVRECREALALEGAAWGRLADRLTDGAGLDSALRAEGLAIPLESWHTRSIISRLRAAGK